MAKLNIRDGDGKEMVHELVDKTTIVGRSSSNNLKISDEKASRQHFKIEKEGEFFKLIDLGSTNGTKLNGKKITVNELLKKGDVIRVGNTNFTYDGPGPQALDETPAPTLPASKINAANKFMNDPDRPKPVDALPEDGLNATVPIAKETAQKLAPSLVKAAEDKKAREKEAEKSKADGGKDEKKKFDPNLPHYVLTIIEGTNKETTYDLGTEAVTMGRHSTNTIMLDDDSSSQFHAEVKKEPMGYVISDLGSTNGTRVKPLGGHKFERIVKTPLTIRMQVKIGKTILEFKNIGKQVEDDRMLGTVVLDNPEVIEADEKKAPGGEDRIAPRPKKATKLPRAVMGALAALVAVGVFVGAIVIAMKVAGPGNQTVETNGIKPPTDINNPDKPATASTDNKLANGDFSEGTNVIGAPKGWKPNPGTPEVKISVHSDGESDPAVTDPKKKYGLVIQKPGSGSAGVRSTVDSDDFTVSPGRVYEVSGAMKNDGDGIYGLQVTWYKSGRSQSMTEQPTVLASAQDWKTSSALVKAPGWAERACVSAFAIGKEGKTSFDNIKFKEKAGEKVTEIPQVRSGKMGVEFESSKGLFAVTSTGITVLENGSLELASKDRSVVSSLSTALETTQKMDGKSSVFQGWLFDFSVQKPATFKLTVGEGANGPDLKANIEAAPGSTLEPHLSFYLTGGCGNGDLEIKVDGKGQKVAAAENKSATGVQSVLFNLGLKPQLYLQFASPVNLETKREGDRRFVSISFSGELGLACATENVGETQQLAGNLKTLDEAVNARNWSQVFTLSKDLDAKYGDKYPEAKTKINSARTQLESAFAPVLEEVNRQLKLAGDFKNEVTYKSAREALKPMETAWEGTPHADKVRSALKQIDDMEAATAAAKKDDQATQNVKRAGDILARGGDSIQVAITLLKKVIRESPGTPAETQAREMLSKAEDQQKQYEKVVSITDRLTDKVKNMLSTGDYEGAVRAVENDPDYKSSKADLTELNQKLDSWRKKAAANKGQ